ncbi:hypothetical protein C5167_009084 [Papaver somniferum]|uniref:Uncharacterized protein n=1 Tax=Papaver somniferum TaxID=3469 RepID=A0A4Y7JZI1_PAPSO|nr:hypothetical protein C5167_009084 [Papaver somniferum]
MQAILSKQAWEANKTLLCTLLVGYGIRNLGAYGWNWFHQHQLISIQLSYTGRIDKRGKQEPLGRKTRVSVWEPKLDILAQKPYNFAYFGSLPPNNHNGSRINEGDHRATFMAIMHMYIYGVTKRVHLEMITDGINWWRLVLAV